MVGESQGILFWAESQVILFQNADCHANLLLFLSIIEKVCHGIHQYESMHVISSIQLNRDTI